MKARRFSTLDKIRLTPNQCKTTAELNGRGTHMWSAGVKINTPDGIGALDNDVYTNDQTVYVFFENLLDVKTYNIDQVSRIVRSRS